MKNWREICSITIVVGSNALICQSCLKVIGKNWGYCTLQDSHCYLHRSQRPLVRHWCLSMPFSLCYWEKDVIAQANFENLQWYWGSCLTTSQVVCAPSHVHVKSLLSRVWCTVCFQPSRCELDPAIRNVMCRKDKFWLLSFTSTIYADCSLLDDELCKSISVQSANWLAESLQE